MQLTKEVSQILFAKSMPKIMGNIGPDDMKVTSRL
jgi:hypothetical protein